MSSESNGPDREPREFREPGPSSFPEAARHAEQAFVTLFPRLFLLPLLVVIAGVLIWLVLVASSRESRSVAEIIADMRSGGAHSRQQDAHALALRISELERENGARIRLGHEESAALVELLDASAGDDFTQAWVAIALGRAGRPEQAVPRLARLIHAPEGSADVRLAAIEGLGLSRVEAAVDPLLEHLRASSGELAWKDRLYGVAALAHLRDRLGARRDRVLAALEPLVDDASPEVAWNTACYLALHFEDGAGEAQLRRLSDFGYLDAHQPRQPELFGNDVKDRWLARALRARGRLASAAGREELEGVRDEAKNRGWRATYRVAIDLLARPGRDGVPPRGPGAGKGASGPGGGEGPPGSLPARRPRREEGGA